MVALTQVYEYNKTSPILRIKAYSMKDCVNALIQKGIALEEDRYHLKGYFSQPYTARKNNDKIDLDLTA